MRLRLSKHNRAAGLIIWCNKHKRNARACRGCPPEQQQYKVIVYLPGSRSQRRTKLLDTRSQEEALILALQFRKEVKSQVPVIDLKDNQSVAAFVQRFIDFCRRPTKNRPPVSGATLSDYKRHLAVLGQALREKKIVPTSIKPDALTVSTAQIVFDYIRERYPSAYTHQKYFITYRTFYNYLLKEELLRLPPNPFNGWNFAKPRLEKRVLTALEFASILNAVDIEPGKARDTCDEIRTHYRPWIKQAFRFALFCGARGQEIPLVKWSDIVYGRTSLAGGAILLRDIKDEHRRKINAPVIKPVEINEDMADLLMEMGYEANKGKDEPLFPGMNANRTSRAFTYYAKSCGIDARFKSLRKTWFTRCAAVVGSDNASLMGGHSGPQVTAIHYINELAAMGISMKYKRVFG